MGQKSSRSFAVLYRILLRSALLGALVIEGGCGFGLYDDSGSPQAIASNDGVPDAGMWWPWACPNGSTPAPASTPQNYAVSGTCSDGGTLALDVNGCVMEANWAVLGLAGVSTNISSSIPNAGGWEVAGTRGEGDGGIPLTCDATASSPGVMTLTCAVPDAGVPACVTTLTAVSGS